MSITTKELFELAGIMWDATVLVDTEDDLGLWADQTPAIQASKAEAMRTVVEALEGMGYSRGIEAVLNEGEFVFAAQNVSYPSEYPTGTVFLRADSGPWREAGILAGAGGGGGFTVNGDSSRFVFDGKRYVRKWVDIREVPHDVKIRDDEGDVLEWRDVDHPKVPSSTPAGWWVLRSNCFDHEIWAYGDSDHEEANANYGPFIEVIDEPKPEQWDNWRDVPNGVTYVSAKAPNHSRWINTDDGRKFWSKSAHEWRNSNNADEMMQYEAPFILAEDVNEPETADEPEQWEYWGNVPQGVVYRGLNDANDLRWMNEANGRKVWHGDWERSVYPNIVNVGPFVRAELDDEH